jgi:glycosyltransferase involved in cell wall biosynthesis
MHDSMEDSGNIRQAASGENGTRRTDSATHTLRLAADESPLTVEGLLGEDNCRRLGIFRLPAGFVLSVVIPCYNEARTVMKVVQRVRETQLPCEIILVDDGSTDGTREILMAASGQPDLKIVYHDRNQGKGSALKTGFLQATGDVVVVQDADLEYDPRDLRYLLQPIVEDVADVVYGSRFSGPDRHVAPYWHLAANTLITKFFSLRHGKKFSDVETCYKLFRRPLIQEIAPLLKEQRFGIELEITARLVRKPGVRFFERPISYLRRSFAEGKKIGWRDGVAALWCICRY